MPGFDVGTIMATLDLDRGPFDEKWDPIVEEVHQFTDEPHTVRLGAEDEEAAAKLDELRVETDELTDRDHSIKVTADTADAQAKLAALGAEEGLAGQGSLAGIENASHDASASVDDFGRSLAAAGSEADRAEASFSRLDRGWGRIGEQVPMTTSGVDNAAMAVFKAQSAIDDLGASADRLQEDMHRSGVSVEQLAIAADRAGVPVKALVEDLDAAVRGGATPANYFEGLEQGYTKVGYYSDLAAQKAAVASKATRVFSLSLDEAAMELVKGGLAAQNAGGDFTDLAGNITPAARLVSQFGVVMDRSSISAVGLGDSLQRFAEGGAASAENVMGDLELRTEASRVAQDALSKAQKAYADGMAAADRATLALGAGLEAADGDIEQATRDLNSLSAASGGAGRGLDNVRKAASGAAGDAGGGMGALATAALTLGPALVDVGGVGVGALLGLGGAALTAGVGILSFAEAAGGLTSVEAPIKAAFASWRSGLQADVLPTVREIPSIVEGALNALTPVVRGTAAGLDQVFASLNRDFHSTDFRQFFDWVGGQEPQALTAFNLAFQNFSGALSKMAENGAPVIHMVEQGIVALGHDLENFSTSSTFHDFVNWIIAEGPQVRTTVDAIAQGIGRLAVAAAPVGHFVLDVVNPLLSFADVLLKLGGPLDSVAIGAIGFGVAFSTLSKVIDIGALAGSAATGIAKLAGALNLISDADKAAILASIGKAAGGTAAETAGLGTSFGALGTALAAVAAPAAVAVGALVGVGAAVQSAEAMGSHMASTTQRVIDIVGGKVPGTIATFGQLQQAMTRTGDAMSAVQKQFSTASLTFSATPTDNVGAAAMAQLAQQSERLAADNRHLVENWTLLGNRFDLTGQEAQGLARTLGINLAQALAPGQVQEFADAISKMAASASLTSQQLQTIATATGQSMPALSSAISKVASSAAASFSAATNVLSAFSGQVNLTATQLQTWYQTQITSAEQFAGNVSKMLQEGFNPNLIQQIISAGPQAAGGLAAAYAQGGTQLAQAVNSSTTQLGKLSTAVQDEGRLAVIAQHSTNTNLVDAVKFGMAEVANAAQNGGNIAAAYKQALAQVDAAGKAAASQAGTDTGNALDTGTVNGINAGKGSIASAMASLFANSNLGNMAMVMGAQTGADLSAGIASGVIAGAGQVNAAAGGVAAGGVAAGKAAIKSGSPSQLAADEVGLPIAQGIAAGMVEGIGEVASSASRLALAGIPAVPNASLARYASMLGGPNMGPGLPPGAGIQVQITHAETIQGQPDSATVNQWQNIIAAHDEALIQKLTQLMPTP